LLGSWKYAALNGVYSGICVGIAYTLLIALYLFLVITKTHFDHMYTPLFCLIVAPIAIGILITIFFLNFKKNKYLCAYLPASIVLYMLASFIAMVLLSSYSTDAEGIIFVFGFMFQLYGPIGNIIGTIIAIMMNKTANNNQTKIHRREFALRRFSHFPCPNLLKFSV